MRIIVPCLVCVAALALASCGTRSSSSVTPVAGMPSSETPQVAVAKTPGMVIVTENDITDRPYRSLGDIEVTVRKWTIFDADPTKEKVADALREKAAEMGADAVILTRYGTVGVGAFSWGQMDGNGRAVQFQK